MVIAEHYLKRWRDAGLIDDSAVARISAWQAQHRRPIWLWALSGMGALAIGLGVVAVVAANWEGIPAGAKLAGDLLRRQVLIDQTQAFALAWREQSHRIFGDDVACSHSHSS